MSKSSFAELITKILEEPNATILSKYHDNRLDTVRNDIEKKKKERQRAYERKEMRDENYTLPTAATNAKYEKLLRDIATRGVVTLFNAIPKHQKQLKKNLENVNTENDMYKHKTIKIEQKSRNKLIKSLNKSGKEKFEINNNSNAPPKKKRRIINNSNASPMYLQSILMDDNNDNRSDNKNDSSVEIDTNQNYQSDNGDSSS